MGGLRLGCPATLLQRLPSKATVLQVGEPSAGRSFTWEVVFHRTASPSAPVRDLHRNQIDPADVWSSSIGSFWLLGLGLREICQEGSPGPGTEHWSPPRKGTDSAASSTRPRLELRVRESQRKCVSDNSMYTVHTQQGGRSGKPICPAGEFTRVPRAVVSFKKG